MQAKGSESKKKILIPIVAVIGVALVIVLSNRPSQMPNGTQIIESEEQYNYALSQVSQMTPGAVSKFNMGIELEQPDKDAAKKGALIFDSMNAFRPDMTAGLFEAGLLYYLSGDTDTALSRLQQAIADESQPVNLKAGTKAALNAVIADCHHMLSVIAFDRHDYTKAADEANIALHSSPPRESYYFARAQAEVQLNRISDAKKDLKEALKLNPSYVPATRLDGFLKH